MSNLLSQASLVMIPSGYKEDVVYSQIPTSGAGDLSFTRASNGTRINSAGLVEVCPWNLVGYSEQFDDSYWFEQNGSSVTSNSTTAPNGTTTADTLNVTTTSYSSLYNIASLGLPLGQYTQSIYAKKGTKNWLYILDLGGSSARAWFNLDTGVVGTVASGYTASIESVGNGWYRCILTETSNRSPIYFQFGASDADNSFTPSSSGTVFIWGAQLNIGSTAKPYFPTTDRLNVPRLTYQNGGGGCPSLLLEKQSTNVLTYSEQFDDSAWTKTNGNGGSAPIVTANYGVSPDGTQNADRIQLARTTQTNSFSYVFQNYVASVGVAYTWSVWLKSLSGTPSVALSYDGANYLNVVTLTTEWQRYTFTTNSASTGLQATFLLFEPNGTSLTADFLAWGAQLEASSYVTSYIPTTSSSATRVADACFKTGISSLIGQSEGVLFAEIIVNITGVNQNLELGDGTGDNRVTMRLTTSNTFQLVIVQGSSVVFNQSSSATFSQGQKIKIAAAYKSGAVTQLFFNGVSVLSATSGTISGNLTAIYDGNAGGVSDKMNSPISQLVIFKTQLTNAELITLTS